MKRASSVLSLFLLVVACGGGGAKPGPVEPAAGGGVTAPAEVVETPDVAVPAEVRAIVDAPDRSDADRALDAGRKPAELIAFAGIEPGMHVAELGAGAGYTTELLARAVGAGGVVYAENNQVLLGFVGDKWAARLATPVMKNVVRSDRELEDPLPPEAHDLDAVLIVLIYHDTVWMKADRAAMNKAVMAALEPGGSYIVVDHSGRPGTGTTETDTLHRIEEKVVRDEVQEAGFQLVAAAGFLRNPNDARDWNDSPRAAAERRGTSDRFVLRFVKPAH